MKSFAIMVCILLAPLYAQEMDINTQISNERAREQVGKASIASLDEEIAKLRQDLLLARERTATLERSLYSKAGLRKDEMEAQWKHIAEFIRKVDEIAFLPVQGLQALEQNWQWAEQNWSALKKLPVTKLMRTDTLSMQAEQGVLRLQVSLEKYRQKLKNDSLAAVAAAAKQAVVVPPPPPPAPLPPPEPVAVAPPAPPPPPPPEPIPEKSTFDGKVYRVGKASDRKDGTLWEIAAIVYGNPQKWQRLWRANKDRIKNPDRIVPGMVLIVPEGPVAK